VLPEARKETVRKAKPLLANDLRDLIDGLDQQSASGAHDAALLALGWAAALRRSELVSLDWHRLSTGGGFVPVDERGIFVTLMAQDQAETIVIPAEYMPKACQALESWAAVAELKAREPVFRAVDQRQFISSALPIAAWRLSSNPASRLSSSSAAGARQRPKSLSS
jgi:integrase